MSGSKTMYEVVTKLVGPTLPVGETHTDEQRFENLKVLTQLVESLIKDISLVAQLRGQYQHSISKAGKYAHDFLDSLGIQEQE